MRRTIGTAVGAILAAFFFIMAIRFCMTAQKYDDIVTAALDGEPLNASQALEICEREAQQESQQGSCFWGEAPKTQLSCRETGGSSIVTAVLTVGNPELIVPGIGALAYQEDGCFIDTQTAVELFGTQQASGQTIWCGEASYVVCGTVESMNRIMVRQANEEDESALDMVSLYLTGDSTGGQPNREEAQQFLLRYNLSGQVMDAIFLNALVKDSLLILPLILGVCFAYLLTMQARGASSVYAKGAYMLAAVAAMAVVLYFAARNIEIPADMIPTKWSDFSFWKTWWEKQRGNFLLLLSTAQGEAQLTMLWNIILSVICNLCAVFSETLLLLTVGKKHF